MCELFQFNPEAQYFNSILRFSRLSSYPGISPCIIDSINGGQSYAIFWQLWFKVCDFFFSPRIPDSLNGYSNSYSGFWLSRSLLTITRYDWTEADLICGLDNSHTIKPASEILTLSHWALIFFESRNIAEFLSKQSWRLTNIYYSLDTRGAVPPPSIGVSGNPSPFSLSVKYSGNLRNFPWVLRACA